MPTQPRSPGARLRSALRTERPLQVVGTINAYCARLAQRAGYRAIYLSGAGVANASLGVPDLGITSLNDVCEDVRRITQATDLPLLVDADTGWGGAFMIGRTVRELARAGAAGCHIEDQVQANLVVVGDPPVATMPAAASRQALLACCDDTQVAWAVQRMGPQAVIPFTQPVNLGGAGADAFAALPRAYVSCTLDRAIPVALQRRMLQSAGCDPVIELEADHSPWISRSDELASVLDGLAAGR